MRNTLVLATVLMCLIGCNNKYDPEKQISGSYELAYSGGRLTLEVREDHTYIQILKPSTDKELKTEGKWKHLGDCVDFESLIVPSEVSGGRSNIEKSVGWCLPIDRTLNGTRFVVSGDRDIFLTSVKPR